MSLELVPISLKDAKAFVGQEHRHHKPPLGHKFSIAIADETGVRGVAIIGRPSSRHRDDGITLEVTRLATDGVKNGCSMLYGAAWRAAKAMGYKLLITYILEEEPGTSLVAAGWVCIGQSKGGKWSRSSRPRLDEHPTQPKKIYAPKDCAA